MKSMLAEVDLRMVKRPLVHPAFNNLVDRHMNEKHINNLRTALVAALRVIDTMNADGVIKYAKAVKELETALEPFKVASDDAKVAPK